MKQKQIIAFIAAAIGLLVLPLLLQGFGNAWVRIADMALLYVLLALGLNIVVGYAGLLDLGYVAFFAIGAYMYGLLASPHLSDTFPMIAAMFPDGMHAPIWIVIPAAAFLAAAAGLASAGADAAGAAAAGLAGAGAAAAGLAAAGAGGMLW